jgi:hypothetical protein
MYDLVNNTVCSPGNNEKLNAPVDCELPFTVICPVKLPLIDWLAINDNAAVMLAVTVDEFSDIPLITDPQLQFNVMYSLVLPLFVKRKLPDSI